MKIPSKPRHPSPTFPPPDSDLHPPRPSSARRKTRAPGSARLKRAGLPAGKRSRPETPLLKWKIDEGHEDHRGDRRKDQNALEEGREDGGKRKSRKGREVAMSARKLAAGLWRLQLPENVSGVPGRSGQLGFQPDVGHISVPFLRNRNSKAYASEANDFLQSPSSTSRNGFLSKLSNSAMEGQTKWDPVCLKTSDEVRQIYSQMKLLDQQASAASVVSVLEAELEQARARIQELEMDRRSSKKKLEHFLRNVSEERVSWRSREHEKVRAFIDDIKAELNRERKNRQRTEILNSKLVNELADAKLSAKRYIQDYEKERKARELIEEVCDELAKEIGEDKAEVEALKRESMKLREEVEEERKMLQMAEVWREERVQMKLVDAKVAVEEKYSLMNKLVVSLENFLRSRSATPDVKEMREAEFLRQAAATVNIQDVKDVSYEPPNPDDIFSVFEEVNFGEPNEREIEQCVAYSPASHASKIRTVSPEVNGINKDRIQRHPIAYVGHNGDIEEDESGWETVSHLEDQGSSYSPDGSAPSAFVRTLSSLCNFSTLTLKSPINPSISSASSTFSMEMDSLPNGSATSPGPSPGPTAAAAPSSKLSHLSESLKLEHQFLRVPFEHYKKTIRANHRVVEREMSSVINGVSEAADSDDMSSDDAVNHLSSLVSRLQGLKRKLEEGSRTEHLQAQRCRARLDHLESADVESLSDWNNTRLNRILVDYMLRMSYYDTAAKLAESRNIQDLVDIDVFQEAKKVIEALQNKEVGPALAWCAENKSRLKKSKSKFEFQLRLQEFIELVRAENNLRAITYAQKYLAPWGTTHMKELQRVFVTVAYKSTTECATYKVLFEPKQWDYLVDQFKQEFCKLYGMTLEPLLNIYLQAGLSALKTPYCYDDDCTKEDPLSQEGFRKLAQPLPYSKQHHSKLVCYITKELMDTENPPQVLPNGYVYSSKALEEMARKNDGKITCPRTGLVCNYTDLVKAYIS